MNKQKLVNFIIQQLENDLNSAIEAAKATYEAATHEESKPENEYDTRGLEASYLAGAQAKRVAEIEETLYIFKHTEMKSFAPKDTIAATALAKVKLLNNSKNQPISFALIMPKGGGLHLNFENHPIQVITPNSPLGEALVGMKAGEIASIEVGSQNREYEILEVQ